jgi:hypothetical protein
MSSNQQLRSPLQHPLLSEVFDYISAFSNLLTGSVTLFLDPTSKVAFDPIPKAGFHFMTDGRCLTIYHPNVVVVLYMT